MVLAKDGDVGNNIHGRDVCRQNHDAWRRGVVGSLWRFSQRLNNFFNTPLQGLVLCRFEEILVSIFTLWTRILLNK